VLTVGMFGVIQMYHFGLDKMHALNETTVAFQALQNEIETLRSAPFSELRNTDKGRFVSKTPALSRLANVKSTVTITDYSDSPRRLKRITARITWTGENGRTIQKTVTTLIADKKP